ncbi:MAG: alpha/beta hydrolase [Cocleimonas sp.]|nr:alpha/beta hydrolase [Cocleimonas sp.]
MKTEILILPGYGNSDSKHWQSLWEVNNPNFKRVNQTSWEQPICSDWIANLEEHVKQASSEVKIVAHSLGCLLLAQWAAQTDLKIAGALLVAVPDPDGKNFPQQTLGFSPITKTTFDFPSILVASSNDPYSSMIFSKACANNWGCRLIELGDYGHINSSSGLDDWQQGLEIITDL